MPRDSFLIALSGRRPKSAISVSASLASQFA
jgi:hypothetical protein